MTESQTHLVRQLTIRGVRRAKDYLAALREGQVATPFPAEILTEAAFAEPLQPPVYVESRDFANRREAGQYLQGRLGQLPDAEVISNTGLWSWLGMFYFDRLVEKDANGYPRLGRDSDVAYIIDPIVKKRGMHRHRLRLAYETYTQHGEDAWLILNQPVTAMEQFAERLAGKPIAFRSTSIVKLAHLLYTDQTTGRAKRGFGGGGLEGQRSPGNLMRFIDVTDQLYMTYDVYGMTAEELLKLLPAEFDRWRPAVAPE